MEPLHGDIQAWADGVYTHQSFQVTEEPGAEPEPIRSVARRLLGLDETQADTLFDANNTRDYVLDSLADYIDTGEAQERTAARSQVLGAWVVNGFLGSRARLVEVRGPRVLIRRRVGG